jgi:lipoate-protein ligase A
VWLVEQVSGPAGRLHAGSAELVSPSTGRGGPGRTVRVLAADAPALVLGSAQRESDFDSSALSGSGLDVVRRRSGGGAVLVDRGGVVWIDFAIPADDPLWDDDVHRASWWVGELWARACDDIGVGPGLVWKGAMRPSAWSGRICFAGLGPGEVTVNGRKVVGVSQRRTREGALFQTAALLRWDPGRLVDLLALDGPSRTEAKAELTEMAQGLGEDLGESLISAVIARLMP